MEKLKLFLKAIWTFLNSRIFVILLIVLLSFFAVAECNRILDKNIALKESQQNIAALNDTIRKEKAKNGALQFSINGFISSEKDLKKINKDLYDEVKSQKGTVISLTSAVIKLKQDSTDLAKHVDSLKTYIGELQKIDSNHFEAPWILGEKYKNNNYFVVKGRTRIGVLHQNPLYLVHDTTYMTAFENQISLKWGEKVEKGKLRVYVESDFPGFTAESLKGWVVDPNDNELFKDLYKKRHWFTGFSVGIGLTPGIDLINQSKFAITAGPTISWTIYTW